MPEKLEEIMKKIHILLAACETSAYSSEDVIVPKRRLLQLLEQLNYAVYEVMEQYEATAAARERALIREERTAAEIRADAVQRSEDVYAASLLYTQDMLQDMKRITEQMYRKTRESYEELLQGYEERKLYMEQNEQELIAQMSAMADAKTYLHIIEETRRKKEAALKQEEEKKVQSPQNRMLLLEEKTDYKPVQTAAKLPADSEDTEATKAAEPVIVVHDTPQVPEGFGRKKEKRAAKNRAELLQEAPDLDLDLDDMEKPVFRAEELDKEYFEWQESRDLTECQEEKGKGGRLRILPKRKK